MIRVRIKFLSIIMMGSLGVSISFADDQSYLPNLRQLKVFKEHSDCSIYAVVRARNVKRYRELVTAREKIKEIAKQRRESLVACGAPTEDSRRALQDEELASRCPKDYQDWLKTGENYLANQVEIQEAVKNIQSLQGIIAYYCGKMADVPDSLPLEPAPEPIQESKPAENPS